MAYKRDTSALNFNINWQIPQPSTVQHSKKPKQKIVIRKLGIKILWNTASVVI